MVKRRRTQVLRHLVLAVLATNPRLHGYGIYKRIIYITQSVWKPSIGTLYRTLNEMVNEGLIRKSSSDSRRLQYEITSAGLECFVRETLPHATKSAGILAEFLEAYKGIRDKGGLPKLPDELVERLYRLRKVLEELMK
ncbi:MAG: PadR family transcriptional regulator [Desulfurococcaceae archaeon]|nr:PadR family transcriptional regulator [Desulfurococcaceae archaeon]